MARTEVTAEFAQTEVSSLLTQAAYHKRQARKHRQAAAEAAREAERLRCAYAASMGFEVVIVPASSQPGGTEHEHHTSP